MKYFNFPPEGTRLDFDKQDLIWIQNSLEEAINGLLTLLGDEDYILSGVKVSGTQLTNGWIYYNNELLRFEGGANNTKFLIVTEEAEQGTGDYEKYAKPGSGVGEILLSNLKRLELSTKLIEKSSFLYNTTPGQEQEVHLDINNYIGLVTIEYNKAGTSDEGDLFVNLPSPLVNDEITFKIRSTSQYHIPYEISYDGTVIVSGDSNVSGEMYSVLQLKSVQGNWICTSLSNSN